MALVFNPFTGNFDNVIASSSDMSFSGGSLNVNGDITLDSGGAFTTTVQAVTPTANRTISFPDQTGTVGLVSGATGNIQYNNAGQLAGTGDFNVDLNWTDAGVTYTGLKVNVTDTASAADSNLIDIQSNGTSQVVVDDDGNVGIGTSSPGQQLTVATSTGNCYIEAKRASQSAGQVALQLTGGTSGTDWILYQPAVSNDLRIFGNSGDRVTVTSAGNVGIGTQSPGANLDISSSSNTTTRINCGTSNASILEFTQSASRKALIRRLNGGELDIINEFGDLRFWTASDGNELERARIDSSGRLLVGTSSAYSFTTNSGNLLNPYLQVAAGVGVEEKGSLALVVNQNGNQARCPGLFLAKNYSPSTSIATSVTNEALGEISFNGVDGTTFVRAAQIRAEVDGLPGANDMPGRLVFSTTADGASTPTEQLRITSDRYVRLASGTGGIQFNGDTAAANALDDYEEGTFTPTLLSDGGVSITLDVTAEGYYRKIGSIVHMWGTIKTTTNLNSANYYQLGTAFTSTLASATHVGTASSSTNAGNANQKSVFSVTSRVSGGLYFVRVSPDYDFSNEDGFSFFISTPV
jgi:hypothetical protein